MRNSMESSFETLIEQGMINNWQVIDFRQKHNSIDCQSNRFLIEFKWINLVERRILLSYNVFDSVS